MPCRSIISDIPATVELASSMHKMSRTINIYFAKVVMETLLGSAYSARQSINLGPAGPTVFGNTVNSLKEISHLDYLIKVDVFTSYSILLEFLAVMDLD